MESTTLEITLISAKDLEDVNLFSDMVGYAVVSIDGDSRTAQRATVDQNGGTNPSWNATVRVPVPADDPSRHVVHVILRTERALGDQDVGEVHIPLNEFFSGSGDAKTPQFIGYQVRKPSSGKPKGVLNLSFNISDAVTSPLKGGGYPPAYPPPSKPNDQAAAYPPPQKGSKPDERVIVNPAGPSAYPAPGGAASNAYPQRYPLYAQPGYGYPPPPYPAPGAAAPYAYPQGYPPYAQPGYGYPPPPYPAPGAAAPYAYPQGYPPYAQPGHGYPPPPPLSTGYGYGAPPQGYGYGAAPPQQLQNNYKFGIRLFATIFGDTLVDWMTSGFDF